MIKNSSFIASLLVLGYTDQYECLNKQYIILVQYIK